MRQRQQATRARSRTGAPQAQRRTADPQARAEGQGYGQGPARGRGPASGYGQGYDQGYERPNGRGPGRGPAPGPHEPSSPWDLPPVAEPPRQKLIWRFLTHTATITTTVVVLLVLAVLAFKPKGDPPPGYAGMSTNEMLTQLSRTKMSKVEAASIANAKRKAFEAKERAERKAREKAKRDARLRARLKAEKEARERAAARAEALARQANTSIAQNIAIGKQMNTAKGWSNCWDSLRTMWMHESGWNERAQNPSSPAYGIPQALPGSKMASAGSDWETHAATQIAWGLSYVEARYNDPCQAWDFWQAHSWY